MTMSTSFQAELFTQKVETHYPKSQFAIRAINEK